MRLESWLVVGALGMLGCSAVVREIELTCENDCAALNEHDGLGIDACFIYQCRADGKGCEKRARDKDGDGVPDETTCGDAGVSYDGALDCDDTSDARVPESDERCDGVDNDCDRMIDEGLYARHVALERRELGLRHVDSLSSANTGESLLVAVTAKTMSTSNLQRTVLHEWPTGSRHVLQEDDASARNCQGRRFHCAPRDVVLAGTRVMLLALGVESVGAAPGRVRAAVRRDWSEAREPLIWDAAEASTSNLADGIDAQAGCEGASLQASEVSLALSEPTRSSEMHGLAVWRTRTADRPGPVRGIDLSVVSNASSVNVTAAEGGCSRAFGADASTFLGFDAPSMEAWSLRGVPGVFVGYDSQRGAELAYVPGVERAAATAFAAARSTHVPATGARQVAIALGPETDDGVSIGMAFRVQRGTAWGVRVAILRFDSKGELQLEWEGEPFDSGASEQLDGPVLTYASAGFRESANASQRGGWLLAWVVGSATSKRLLAARLPIEDPGAVDGPFPMFEGATVSHPFVQSQATGEVVIGFVADAGDGEQLNIGALKCDPEP